MAAQWCNSVCNFHDRAQLELPDFLRTAYEQRNYTKAVELVKFAHRLRQSVQKVRCEGHLLGAGLRRSLKDTKGFLKHYMVRCIGCHAASALCLFPTRDLLMVFSIDRLSSPIVVTQCCRLLSLIAVGFSDECHGAAFHNATIHVRESAGQF